jgi:hypothetical protein
MKQVGNNEAMATFFTLFFALLIVAGPLSAWLDTSRDMNDRDRRGFWPGSRA